MKLITYLQKNTRFSRRNIIKMIDEGKIFLNTQKVESYGMQLVVGDTILLNNKEYSIKSSDIESQKSEILLFHKPLGYVVSKSDPHNQTIYELLPEQYQNWWYIGRLDKNSSGLLLLTNDSKIVYQYEHPKFNIQKEYIVQSQTNLSGLDIARMKKGLYDEGDFLEIMSIESLENTKYRLILNQGKKRHIRRMFRILGNRVISLKRVREGLFELGNLGIGELKIIEIEN